MFAGPDYTFEFLKYTHSAFLCRGLLDVSFPALLLAVASVICTLRIGDGGAVDIHDSVIQTSFNNNLLHKSEVESSAVVRERHGYLY